MLYRQASAFWWQLWRLPCFVCFPRCRVASDREVSLIRVGERVQAPSKAALGQDLLNTVQLKIEDKAHILLFPRVLQYIVLGCFQVFWLLLASIFCLSSKISFLHILFLFLCRIFHFQFQLWFSLPCHIPFWTAVQWVSPRKMMMTPFSRFLVLYFVFEHGKL